MGVSLPERELRVSSQLLFAMTKVTDAQQRRLGEKIVRAARMLLDRAGVSEPPVDLTFLARLQGVLDIRLAPLGRTDAELVPVDNGFIIRLNQSVSYPRRRRFSIAHEIAHTFFMPLSRASRNGPISLNPPKGSLDPQFEERLCDLAASEMLMPEAMFREAAHSITPSIAAIRRLADVFKTSIQATAQRYSKLGPEHSQVTMWRGRHSRIEPVGGQRRGPVMDLESFLLADSQTLVQRSISEAYGTDRLVTGHDLELSCYPPRRIRIEAKGFIQGSGRYVVTVMQTAFSVTTSA